MHNMDPTFLRRTLDIALAAWGALALGAFFGPYAGLDAAPIERSGLHVALLGVCLGLAAIEAALEACRAR